MRKSIKFVNGLAKEKDNKKFEANLVHFFLSNQSKICLSVLYICHVINL